MRRAQRLARALLGQEAAAAVLLVLAAVCVYLFVLRGMQFFEVPSRSMLPTLADGDYLVTLSQRTYERGDIVVLRDEDGYIVKRIAGVGGDTLMVVDGALFINGEYASEPYIAEPMRYVLAAREVPEDHVFLLGDNRNLSDDAHMTGQAHPTEDIVGRVRFRYFPYDRWGRVRSYPLRNVSGK